MLDKREKRIHLVVIILSMAATSSASRSAIANVLALQRCSIIHTSLFIWNTWVDIAPKWSGYLGSRLDIRSLWERNRRKWLWNRKFWKLSKKNLKLSKKNSKTFVKKYSQVCNALRDRYFSWQEKPHPYVIGIIAKLK